MASSPGTRVGRGGAKSGSAGGERDNDNDMKQVIEGPGVAARPNARHLHGAGRAVPLN